MSRSSLLADPSLAIHLPLQDSAASQVIAGGATLLGGNNTADLSVAGPIASTPKALYLDSNPDHVQIPWTGGTVAAFTALLWVRLDGVSGTRDIMGRWSAYGGFTDPNNQRLLVRCNGGPIQFFVRRTNSATTPSASGPAMSAGAWHKVAAVATGSVIRIGIDGVFGVDVSLPGPYFLSPDIDWFLSRAHSGEGPGRYADFAFFSRALSSGEINDWFAESGDPPENLSLPTLTIDSTSFTGSVGSWDAMGAGPLSYEWELRDGTDAAIASGTGTTISGNGSFGGYYYLWIRATNSVGSEEAVSSLVEAGGDPEPITAGLTATLEGITALSAATAPVGAGVTILLDGVWAASSAVSPIAAGVSIALEDVTASATASQSIVGSGSLSVTLEGVTASSAAESLVSAGVSVTLEGITATASAVSPIAAWSTIQLDGVSVTSAASQSIAGSGAVSVVFDGVTAQSAASSTIAAGMTASLDGVTSVASASSLVAAGVTILLDGVTIYSRANDGDEPVVSGIYAFQTIDGYFFIGV